LKGKQILGAVASAVGAIGLGFGLLLLEPDPKDISTATGAAFYSRGDYGTALKIFRTLADQGTPRAQFNVGIMYANGHGVVQDDEEALKWYRLAADQKDPDAQNNIGIMYLRGRGVPRDNVRAHMWFSLAASAATARDAEAGRMNREAVVADMTPVQLAQARELVRRCQQQEFKACGDLAPTRTAIASASPPAAEPQRTRTAPPAAAEPSPSAQGLAVQPPSALPAPAGRPYMPSRVSRVQLSASDVFKKVSPSIFIVYAAESTDVLFTDKSRDSASGSAVAISSDHLITNCHVVDGRPAIALVRGEEIGRAVLTYSNSKVDTCFLKSLDLVLRPVEGVRRYVDLNVGDQVYTIGAPQGAELTIADGIISALRSLSLRTHEGNHVQTSAPISPGSSGGGLFDARGNLIGITTFILNDAQNVNFAVAADEFWR
jgi:hypothetical protein